MKTNRIQRQANRRSGLAVVELAIVAPILLLMLFGIIEFGWLFAVQHLVDHAVSEGARLACMPGLEVAHGGNTKIEQQLNQILNSLGVTVTYGTSGGNTWSRDNATSATDPNEVITVRVQLFAQGSTHGVALPGFVLRTFFPSNAAVDATVTSAHPTWVGQTP